MIHVIDETPIGQRPGDSGYPARLAALPEPPSPLWIAGAWVPSERAVAVVGARAATLRGLEFAHEIGRVLGAAGIDVISGGALGIDGEAHRGALEAGGATVAVLGTGIGVDYPARHTELFAQIRASRGALVTQFPPGSEPRRAAFPQRNAIIAALADAVVVVEAGEQSGTLHTVRVARALGRPVLAVPGSVGTDALLVADALPVWSANDVLAIVEGRPHDVAPPPLPNQPEAQRLYEALDSVPRDVSDLAFRAGLAVGTCAAVVMDLELDGLAARAAGGRYIRLR
jgi:DNA processing protein